MFAEKRAFLDNDKILAIFSQVQEHAEAEEYNSAIDKLVMLADSIRDVRDGNISLLLP